MRDDSTRPMIYVDTSALVPMFVGEARSASVTAWLRRPQTHTLCSADWCVTEVASALAQKLRTRQIDAGALDDVWTSFIAACDDEFLTLLPVASNDFPSAASLCLRPGAALRSGDALHLAVALRSGCKAMLSFDGTLNRNAQACGLAVIAP